MNCALCDEPIKGKGIIQENPFYKTQVLFHDYHEIFNWRILLE